MTNKSPDESTFLSIPKYYSWVISAGLFIIVFSLLTFWVMSADNRAKESYNLKLEQLQQEVDECRAEATAWYNSSTALSDAIAIAALKGLPASNVDTQIAIPFAVEGHALRCIDAKLPTD